MRYLRSPKSHSIINIISIVSVVAVAVPTAAMVILLSVYNGLDDLLKSLYVNFDPQIRITSAEGRYFGADSLYGVLNNMPQIESYSGFLEDNALADYNDRQYIATVRGVDSSYTEVVPIESMVIRGEYKTLVGDSDAAVVGAGLAYQLGINSAMRRSLYLIAPSSSATTFIPTSFYRSLRVMPEAIFAIDAETDGKYVITSLDFAQRLFSRVGKVTAVGLKLSDGTDEALLQSELIERLGGSYIVENRYQQKQTLYTIMRYEKLAIYFIIMLVLLVASFSMIGSLIMLIEDKRDHIAMLSSVGATGRFIRDIFVTEGLLITALGIVIGLVVGLGVTLLQQYVGLVDISSATMLIDSYPVRIDIWDLLLVVVSVAVVGYTISAATVAVMVKKVYNRF